MTRPEWSKKNRQERLAKGICPQCPNPVVEGRASCEYHLQLYSKRASKRFKDRHTAGICVRCGDKVVDGHIYCASHLDYMNTATATTKHNRKSTSQCLNCPAPAQLDLNLCEKCHAVNLKAGRKTTSTLKDQAYNAYGGYRCACCGENRDWALTLDHINNDGAKHRRSMKSGSSVLYRWLRDNNYPAIIQVLCATCQLGKLRNKGICPHTLESRDTHA